MLTSATQTKSQKCFLEIRGRALESSAYATSLSHPCAKSAQRGGTLCNASFRKTRKTGSRSYLRMPSFPMTVL